MNELRFVSGLFRVSFAASKYDYSIFTHPSYLRAISLTDIWNNNEVGLHNFISIVHGISHMCDAAFQVFEWKYWLKRLSIDLII